MPAEIGGGPQAADLRHPLHREIAALEQFAGAGDALGLQPLHRSGARGRMEAADQGARAGVRLTGEVGDGERLPQPFGGPVQQGGEGVVTALGHRRLDVLGLAAGPVRGGDQLAGAGVGDLGAEVLAYQVQTDVDGGGGARSGEHIAVIDVQDRRVHGDRRIAFGEQIGVHPVRGRRPAVEKSGRSQGEGARAEGDQSRPAPVGLAQRRHEDGRRIAVHIGGGRYENGVGIDQLLDTVRGVGGEPRLRAGRLAVRADRADPQVVPVRGSVHPVPAEDVAGDGEFEERHAVGGGDGEGGHTASMPGQVAVM